MKSYVSIAAAVSVFATAAVAAPQINTALTELNAEIVRILVPFQNNLTKATLAFSKLETNPERVQAIKMNGLYRKVGDTNKLQIKVDDLSYDYGDGKTPTTKLKGSIRFDFTKAFSQDMINSLVKDADKFITQNAVSYFEEYGEAATVSVTEIENKQDEAGNYVATKGTINGAIDLTKLPEGKAVDSILFTSIKLSLSLDVKKGVAVDAVLVSNPLYKGFFRDDGLKEEIEKLLAKDPAALKQIQELFSQIDAGAASLVNMKAGK